MPPSAISSPATATVCCSSASPAPASKAQTRRLVQEISLQKLPVMVVLLDARPDETHLTLLDPYVSRRLYWPGEAAQLTPLVREFGCGREFNPTHGSSLEDLLSQKLLALTPSLLPLVDRIALAASHDVTVLLNGETGTGKTYLARLIHEHSPRRQHRFLTVPCGAMSANLVESEFFGHVKGAFTGADRPKVGKFAAVGEGTLLLDEIDTLALEQQATLLRVIETGEFEPVGSIETQTLAGPADRRGERRSGRGGQPRQIPPRPLFPPQRDVVPSAAVARARDGHRAAWRAAWRCASSQKFNKDLFEIHPDAMAALEAFHWPGNLRQLENVMQHAVLRQLGAASCCSSICRPPFASTPHRKTATRRRSAESLQHQRDLTERSVIQRALISNGYCRSRAASALGISRVTLYKKMKKYGLMNGWHGL